MAGAPSVKTESFGNRNLWQLVNGTGVIRPKELVIKELKKNEEKILQGLSFFKKPLTVSGEVLKEKKLSKVHHDFLLKLSSFLCLSEEGSYELFNSFLASDYRGSQKNLQSILSNDRHSQSLIHKVRDFYFTERLYLLQCLKVVANFWQNDEHPYKDEFQRFMEGLNANNQLFDKIKAQLKNVLEENLPSWETHSVLMTDRQALLWAHQNLKEQCELLEVFLIYLKDFEIGVQHVIDLIEMFKRHGFGRRQMYKHILGEPADQFVRRIGYLEILILLEAMDLEALHVCSQLGSFDDHFILKDEETYKKVDKLMTTLGSEPCHGPILLCWATVRLVYGDQSDLNITRKMGNTALQLRVFDLLYSLLNTEPFNRKSTYVCPVAQYVLYSLFVNVMSAFEESTLGRQREIEVLHKVLCQILQLEFCAEDLWQKGLEEGLGSVFQTALMRFPLDFTPLIQFSTALSEANEESAKRIFQTWKCLSRYTELLDQNYSADLIPTKDQTVWKLAKNKFPFTGKDFKIDAGTYGQLDSGKVDEGPIIQWEVTYNGWHLLLCEIEELLHHISYGTGNISVEHVTKVTLITQFVKVMMTSCPDVIDDLKPITECMYQVIQRFSRINPVPLDLIASCVDCLNCVAKRHPKEVWHNMKQTGLLPFLTGNVDNFTEVLSGQELSAGSYGLLLAGSELTQGQYPVTCSLLSLISDLIQPFYQHGMVSELMAPVLYMMREVFPVFQKWRYVNQAKREHIGHNCLGIFHKILTFLAKKKTTNLNRPQLQQVCVYSLLFTEAGRALLDIIGTGSDTIEIALAQQGSIVDEGIGTEIIQLIQISFSVLNRLLLLKSPDLPVSPMENALSSQPVGRQTQHIVATIAQYIYHRHNPRLPTLACLLLKRLAMVSRMSILACLGGEAEAIRDMYLTRLQAVTEDLRLKVVILEFLSVCVEAQPGLIEIFLNVQPSSSITSQPTSTPSKIKRKDSSLGKTSCLLTVLDLMEAKKQGKYYCPPDLLCACLDFIHSLWAGMRETAMAALRERETFWISVCAPLTRDIPASSDSEYQTVLPYQIKTISFVMKVLAQEIYSLTRSKLDNRLKKVLKDISQAKRLKYWSEYVKECLVAESDREIGEENLSENPSLQLLIAWKNFLITVTKCNVAEIQLNDGLKEQIIIDLMEGLQVLVAEDYTELKVKLAQNLSALLFTLIKLWTGCLQNRVKMIKELESVVTQMLANSKTLLPTIQLGVLGSITAILQYNKSNKTINVGQTSSVIILPTMCSVLQQSCRELPSPADLISKSDDNNILDVKIKLQMVTCCLIQEIILQCDRHEDWLPVIQEHLVLSTLLSAMDIYIKSRQALSCVHAAFLLLQTIAKTEKGAESIVMSGLVQHTCLPIMCLYQKETDFFPKVLTSTKNKESASSTEEKSQWHTVLCVCIDLYSTVLGLLKYSFLEDALNFVGAHQDRMQECLERSRITLTEAAMLESEKTCAFVNLLSSFSREWRLHLGESLVKLQTSLMYMSQTFIAFLMRPSYLQQVLEQQSGQSNRSKFSLSPKLQQQSSTEDIDKPSSQLVHIQKRMLEVLAHSISSLKKFTPDLCEILYEQSMDYSEFEPFLALGFSGPSPDQDSIPSFGTFTSLIRDVCVKVLMKQESKSSPLKNVEENATDLIPKSLVHFVMENALYIVMSQATRYLRDPNLPSSEKQLLKRELGTEMNYFLMELQRYLRRGTPSSPSAAKSPRTNVSAATPLLGRSLSQTSFATNPETEYFKFVQEFVIQVLK